MTQSNGTKVAEKKDAEEDNDSDFFSDDEVEQKQKIKATETDKVKATPKTESLANIKTTGEKSAANGTEETGGNLSSGLPELPLSQLSKEVKDFKGMMKISIDEQRKKN